MADIIGPGLGNDWGTIEDRIGEDCRNEYNNSSRNPSLAGDDTIFERLYCRKIGERL
jgi:hypothetical protein